MPLEEICPTCKKPLDKVREEYHSIGTYTLRPDGTYSVENPRKDISEEYIILCPYCNTPLKIRIIEKIKDKLPKI
uniref:Uncharacterized protein n=1 Tax=viral metagenome TaxID=1070528 RepID=A0A6H1ZLP3_9ZZZZ